MAHEIGTMSEATAGGSWNSASKITNGMLHTKRIIDTKNTKKSQQETKANMNADEKSRGSRYRMWQSKSEPTMGHQNHQTTNVR